MLDKIEDKMSDIIKKCLKDLMNVCEEKYSDNDDDKVELFFKSIANLCSVAARHVTNEKYGSFAYAGQCFRLQQEIAINMQYRLFDEYGKKECNDHDEDCEHRQPPEFEKLQSLVEDFFGSIKKKVDKQK